METSSAALKSIRFAVADVKPGAKILDQIDLRQSLFEKTRNQIVTCPNAAAKVLAADNFHSLISAAFLAFKNHYPLVLSPDMIWQTVLQGVAQHVNNHSKELRHRLVAHETKIELVVKASGLPDNDAGMLQLTRAFTARIIKHVPPAKHFLFQTEFSTTTDVDRIAGAVAIMDAFQAYFDYVVYCICGIPAITLEGTPEDWVLLRSKVTALHESDLELSWWTKHILPLCDQFVRAASGDVDRAHWKDICKLTTDYGIEDLNGWLLKFIPYVKRERNGPAIDQNPLFNPPDSSVKTGLKHGVPIIVGCTSEMLPPGLSRAPVTFQTDEQSYPIEFVAGFVGVTQSPDDLSLRPLTGWAICEGSAIDRQLARLLKTHETSKPAGMDPWDMCSIFNGNLPADVWRFYSQTDGAVLTLPNSGGRCRILPLAEIKPVWDHHAWLAELRASGKRGEISPQELEEQESFNLAHGHMLRIADLGDGRWYVYGHYPEYWRNLFSRFEKPPSEPPKDSMVIFLWSGVRTEESFVLAAPSFNEWLASLLGN